MNASHLTQWMEHPEQLDRDSLYELRTLVNRYPYAQLFRLLYLKNLYLLHDADFGNELRRSVLYVSDRRVLFRFIEGCRYEITPTRATPEPADTTSTEPGIDRTMSLIDSFLASAPEEHSVPADIPSATDYTPYLMQEDEEPDDRTETEETGEEGTRMQGQNLIDDFLNEEKATESEPPTPENRVEEQEETPQPQEETPQPQEEWPRPTEEDGEQDEGFFTETLARIYVKQHKYEKALEIIKALSLNYPKKNAYFADQIRFLEKVIANSKSQISK